MTGKIVTGFKSGAERTVIEGLGWGVTPQGYVVDHHENLVTAPDGKPVSPDDIGIIEGTLENAVIYRDSFKGMLNYARNEASNHPLHSGPGIGPIYREKHRGHIDADYDSDTKLPLLTTAGLIVLLAGIIYATYRIIASLES